MADLNEFQSKIGYTFKNRHLLEQALTHSSYANEKHMKKHSDNERLEFLGDAVLEIVSSEFLFINYPQKPEGELTKLRASIVCEPTLALCTKPLDLGKYLRLGRGEDHTGGRKRKSILSDALEAVIGAIYLDGGFTNAKEFVLNFILNDIEHKQLFYDSKTILQEIVQAKGREDLSFVWDAVRQLPVQYREAVHLFYYEGLSTRQIASVLNRSEATIRSDLHRGREQLKRILKEAYDFEV